VPASGPSAAPTSTQAATPLLPFPVESVTSAAAGTVQSTLGTVDQVADSLPVTVPQLPPVPPLPVQTPPPPKLP
jgi:hypothetical protein